MFLIEFVTVDSRILRPITAGWLELSVVKCLFVGFLGSVGGERSKFRRCFLRKLGKDIKNMRRKPTADNQLNNNSCNSFKLI